jgi:hypothetical protein
VLTSSASPHVDISISIQYHITYLLIDIHHLIHHFDYRSSLNVLFK